MTNENQQNVPQLLKEFVNAWLSAILFMNSWYSAQVLKNQTRFCLEACLERGGKRRKGRERLEKQMAQVILLVS